MKAFVHNVKYLCNIYVAHLRLTFMLRSSGLWCHAALWWDTSISEVHA